MGMRRTPSRPCRTSAALFLAVALASSFVFAQQQNFVPAETAIPLAKRQGCIADTYSCASLGSAFNNICCASGQACTLDANNNPACCPSGAICTGTAPSTFAPPPTTTGSTATTTVVSYVTNSLFSFPYAPTSFANSAACSSAVSQCGVDYAVCTSRLEGQQAGYGVTVVVPGSGGTTVVGGGGASTTLPPISAMSICSSLSSVACGGLQYDVCTMTAPTGFYVGTSNAAPPRPTAACLGLVGAVAGLGMWNGL